MPPPSVTPPARIRNFSADGQIGNVSRQIIEQNAFPQCRRAKRDSLQVQLIEQFAHENGAGDDLILALIIQPANFRALFRIALDQLAQELFELSALDHTVLFFVAIRTGGRSTHGGEIFQRAARADRVNGFQCIDRVVQL